jgi:hypothetical protein
MPHCAYKARCWTRRAWNPKTLSQIVGAQVFLKFENLQFTASFKERGACNKLTLLTPAEAPAWRGGHERGQPCAGRGLPRAAAGAAGGDRDAALYAGREGGAHARLWRRGGAARRHAGRGARPRLPSGRFRRADLCASLRRRGGGRRPGHAGAGDAARRARPGHAGDCGGRRRADCGRGHCGQGAQARHRGHWRADFALSGHGECRDRARTTRRARRPLPRALPWARRARSRRRW